MVTCGTTSDSKSAKTFSTGSACCGGAGGRASMTSPGRARRTYRPFAKRFEIVGRPFGRPAAPGLKVTVVHSSLPADDKDGDVPEIGPGRRHRQQRAGIFQERMAIMSGERPRRRPDQWMRRGDDRAASVGPSRPSVPPISAAQSRPGANRRISAAKATPISCARPPAPGLSPSRTVVSPPVTAQTADEADAATS